MNTSNIRKEFSFISDKIFSHFKIKSFKAFISLMWDLHFKSIHLPIFSQFFMESFSENPSTLKDVQGNVYCKEFL